MKVCLNKGALFTGIGTSSASEAVPVMDCIWNTIARSLTHAKDLHWPHLPWSKAQHKSEDIRNQEESSDARENQKLRL